MNLNSAINKWRRKAENIDVLLTDATEPDNFKKERDELLRLCQEVEDVTSILQKLQPGEPILAAVMKIREDTQEKVRSIRQRICELEEELKSITS